MSRALLTCVFVLCATLAQAQSLGDLRAPDAALRANAARDLGTPTANQDTIDALILLLGDPAEVTPLPAGSDQQLAAVGEYRFLFVSTVGAIARDALAAVGPSAVPSLMKAADTPGAGRHHAILALGQIGDPRAHPSLVAAASAKTARVRRAAALAFSRVKPNDPGTLSALRTLLADSDSTVRSAALQSLFEGRESENQALLIDLLSDPDSGVQTRTRGALYRVGVPILPALHEAMGSSEATTRQQCMKLLRRIEHPSSQPAAIASLADPDGSVRAEAIGLLASLADPESVAPLTALLDGSDPEVQIAALRALGRPRTDAFRAEAAAVSSPAIEALLLGRKTDKVVRLEALRAAGALGANDAVFEAAKWGLKKHPVDYLNALGVAGDQRSVAAAASRTRDKDKAVRTAAARALGTIGGEPARAALAAMSEDGSFFVRLAATTAGGHASGDPVQAFVKMLAEPGPGPIDGNLMAAAVDELVAIGGEAEAPLLAAAKGEPAGAYVLVALAKLRSAAAVDVLREKGLTHQSNPARIAAARALGELGDKDAADGLFELLRSDKFNEKEAAAVALGRLKETEATAVLLRWARAEKKSKAVKPRVAVVALGWMGDTAATEPLIELYDRSIDAVQRQAIIVALGRIGDARALPLVLGLTDNDDGAMRSKALVALGGIGKRDAAAVLLAALLDGDKQVRRAVGEQLGALFDADHGADHEAWAGALSGR